MPSANETTGAAMPQDLAFPVEDFRTRAPAAGTPRPFRLPPVQAFTLPSGIAVYLVEQHALPLVSIDLNFDGGAAVDPPGKEGLASVCMAMLTEGTTQLDKLAYAERLADTASSIGGYAGDDSVGLTLSSLARHMDATFAQFVDTLREPGFRASDFDRMIRRRIEGVRSPRAARRRSRRGSAARCCTGRTIRSARRSPRRRSPRSRWMTAGRSRTRGFGPRGRGCSSWAM